MDTHHTPIYHVFMAVYLACSHLDTSQVARTCSSDMCLQTRLVSLRHGITEVLQFLLLYDHDGLRTLSRRSDCLVGRYSDLLQVMLVLFAPSCYDDGIAGVGRGRAVLLAATRT